MTPLAIASIVVVTIMAGAFLGGLLRTRLPEHHLDSDTKDMVKVGIGFLTTLTALVLGLIIAAAKSSFDTQAEEVQTAAVKIALLDNDLRQLGSAGDPIRELVRQVVSSRISTVWGRDGRQAGIKGLEKSEPRIVDVQNALRALSLTGEAQHAAWLKAQQSVDDLARLRSLAIAKAGSSITMPLLGLLVFWLAVIALGLNLFSPRNWTIYVLDLVCAVSSAAAIFLILEMDQPFGGIIQISDAPLQAALVQMKR